MEVEPPSRPRGTTSPRASSTSPSTSARACASKDVRASVDPTLTSVRYHDAPEASLTKKAKQVRVSSNLVESARSPSPREREGKGGAA
eukprot:6519578-Alexandrium_andersonii.AAC.1